MNSISKSGFVLIKDNFLCLRFQYNKERYKYLYSLSETYYSKDEKLWYTPIRHFPKLYNSKLFSKETIDYQTNKQELELKLKNENLRKENALKNLKENPFSLSMQDILIIEPDVTITLSKDKKSLLLFAKPRTKIKQELLKNSKISFLKEKHLFFVPTDYLNVLLKSFMENKVLFAVEKEASNLLQTGKELRQELALKGYLETSDDFEKALIYPFIYKHLDSNNLYELIYSDTNQLTIGFKHIKSHPQRKKYASNFTENELEKVLYNFSSHQTKCYLTKDVKIDLENKTKNLKNNLQTGKICVEDESLSLYIPDICYLVEQDPILLIKKELFNNTLANDTEFSKLTKELHNVYLNHYLFRFTEKDVLNDYEKLNKILKQHNLNNINFSKSFVELLEDIKQRKFLINRCEYFRKLKDATINFNDKEFEAKLFPHQRVGVSWLLEFKNALLGDDMGLGKTLTVLSTFKFLREKEEIDLLLVICPNSLVTNWKKEAENWTPDLWTKLIVGTKSKREKTLKKILTQGVEIGIINYESARLEDIASMLLEIAKKKKVLICFDESQKLKNPTSKTFKALRKIALYSQRKILLSGTPIPCNIVDIWSQMLILDDGKRFGKNFYAWLTKIAEVGNKWSEFAVKKFKVDKVNEVIDRVSEILLRRKKEEVINLPEKLFSVRDLEMVGAQKTKYDALCKELLVELTNMDGETYTKQIDSVLEQYLRAVQLASNPRLLDETWKGEPIKFLELDDIVEELVKENGKKLVIWTNYKKNIDELTKRYEKLGTKPYYGDLKIKERQEIIDDFQNKDGKTKILIGIPAAGGVGITLHAAQTAVYLDKTWNAEHWLQSIDRVHRIGQNGTVNIISLHAAKVDDVIYKNLRKKEKQQSLMLGDKKQFIPIMHPSKEELIEALIN